MIIGDVILYCIMGAFIGGIFAIFFFRVDDTWKKIFSSAGGLSAFSGIFLGLNQVFNITNETLKVWLAVISFISCIVGAVTMFYFLCKMLKEEDGRQILRVVDIVMGKKSYIDKYYETREKELDKKLKYDEIIEKNKELEKREQELSNREKFLEEQQRELDTVLRNQVVIELPVKQQMLISHDFISVLPSYIGGVAKFITDMNKQTSMFSRNIKNAKNELDQKLIGYLLGIATLIISDIFETESSDVRVHFRYYDCQSDSYKKIISVAGKKILNQTLTVMPFTGSMIEKSFKYKRALIKSLNVDSDIKGRCYNIWQDYMTFSFYQFIENNRPLLTMGISVKNRIRYKNLLYFLNFYQIKNVIQEHLVEINSYYKLSDFVKKMQQKEGEKNE